MLAWRSIGKGPGQPARLLRRGPRLAAGRSLSSLQSHQVSLLPSWPGRPLSLQLRLLSVSPHLLCPGHSRAVADEIVDSLVVETVTRVSPPPPVLTASGKEELIIDVPPAAAPVSPAVTSPPLDFALPERPAAVLEPISIGVEPSFVELGLCSWWPSGRMQVFLEHLHSGTFGLEFEWYSAIMISTLAMRMGMFYFVVMAQKNTATLANHNPRYQELMNKMNEAKQRGDILEQGQAGLDLQKFMKEKNISPFRNAIPLIAQGVVFLSFMGALRGMSNCPVPSLTSGGLFWFPDFTEIDPYYALPILTSCTVMLQMKLGADGLSLDAVAKKYRNALMCMPFVLLIFTKDFASCVTFYWFTTSLISVGQASILRIPAVRGFFDIPLIVKHKTPVTPSGKKKGFVESLKDSFENMKAGARAQDNRELDDKQFRAAGEAKVVKTYKFDPTKPLVTPASTKRKYYT